MDEIQQGYSQFVKGEIAENANPYPTGVQGFRAGVEYERGRIMALLSTHFIDDEGFQDDGLVSLEYTIALINGENNAE